MSFVKKTWKDRQSEYPTRRKLISTGIENEYDIARSEGAVSDEGDPFNAETMNNLEERIDIGIQAINTQYEVVVPIEGWVLNSTTNLYELTISNALAHEYTKKPTWGLVNVETTAEGIEAEETAFAVIKTAGFSEGTILLTATEVPETSVTIIVTVL